MVRIFAQIAGENSAQVKKWAVLCGFHVVPVLNEYCEMFLR